MGYLYRLSNTIKGERLNNNINPQHTHMKGALVFELQDWPVQLEISIAVVTLVVVVVAVLIRVLME